MVTATCKKYRSLSGHNLTFLLKFYNFKMPDAKNNVLFITVPNLTSCSPKICVYVHIGHLTK